MALSQQRVMEWMGRVQRAKGLQQEQHRNWRNALDLYNCEFFDKVYGRDSERTDVHFANWYVDLLVALTYFRDPFIFIKSTHSKYSEFARTAEKVVNYHWPELKIKQEFKRVIKSALLMPPGWMKLGYTAKFGQDVAKEENIIQEVRDLLLPRTPESKGELNEFVEEEQVFASWIPSWNILMPEGYQLVSRMPYLIEIENVSVIDFMANPLYKNKEKAKTSGSFGINQGESVNKVPFSKQTASKKESDFDFITLFHIWDRRHQERHTISGDTWHFSGDWPYDMDGFPFKPLIFDESLPQDDKSRPYPINAIVPIFPQIIENSNSRTQMTKHRKRSAAYILAQKGLLTEEDITQLEEAEEMQIVYVSRIDAVQAGPLPALPADVFNVNSVIQQDLQQATNMGQLMFQPQPGQRTATQAQIAQSGLQLKASAKVDAVEDLTTDVARNILQLCWQFYSRDKVSEIVGEAVTENMWPTLPDDRRERRRIIQRELQFKIDAGSAAPPKDETVDRKQFMDAVSIAASIAPERLKKDEVLRQLFDRFKYIKDLDRIVISNDEGEIKAAQEENQFLSANSPQVVSPNENHEIHVQVHAEAQPTDATNVHVADHGDFLGITQKPQAGDSRPPTQSTNPEIARQGITNQADLQGETQNMGVQTGNIPRPQ